MLQEEVKNRVEKRLDVPEIKNLPPEIIVIAEGLTKSAQETMGQEIEEIPKTVIQSAFPPCINAIYQAASTTHHLSQMERFTLTAFLLNIGMPPEKVSEIYKSFSDYNERLTRYQIEHIAGERGSGTQYTCSTMLYTCKPMVYAKTEMIYVVEFITRLTYYKSKQQACS